MEYTSLGNTGLRVSVAGLGCGGFSRLGQGTGSSGAESIAIVRQALDLGVNFIDTAAGYRTESIVGQALEDVDRDAVVLSTKGAVAEGGDRKSTATAVIPRARTWSCSAPEIATTCEATSSPF